MGVYITSYQGGLSRKPWRKYQVDVKILSSSLNGHGIEDFGKTVNSFLKAQDTFGNIVKDQYSYPVYPDNFA